MIVPAGIHTIEFKFEPQVYKTGEKISYASSILLVLIAIGTFGFLLMRKNETSTKA
jgi:LPXTG-motif cell wall-anchored protein